MTRGPFPTYKFGAHPPQHSTLFSIPLTDVYLDPKLDLRSTNSGC